MTLCDMFDWLFLVSDVESNKLKNCKKRGVWTYVSRALRLSLCCTASEDSCLWFWPKKPTCAVSQKGSTLAHREPTAHVHTANSGWGMIDRAAPDHSGVEGGPILLWPLGAPHSPVKDGSSLVLTCPKVPISHLRFQALWSPCRFCNAFQWFIGGTGGIRATQWLWCKLGNQTAWVWILSPTS